MTAGALYKRAIFGVGAVQALISKLVAYRGLVHHITSHTWADSKFEARSSSLLSFLRFRAEII